MVYLCYIYVVCDVLAICPRCHPAFYLQLLVVQQEAWRTVWLDTRHSANTHSQKVKEDIKLK